MTYPSCIGFTLDSRILPASSSTLMKGRGPQGLTEHDRETFRHGSHFPGGYLK